MRHALRLFVLLLALTIVGATAALTQVWVQQRAQAQFNPANPAQAEAIILTLRAYRADQSKALAGVVGVSFVSLLAVALASGGPRREDPLEMARARGERHQVEHLARATVAQGEALVHERGSRLRTEENLHLQETLARHALEEKINLGRDLHDNLSQTLYALSLTLESARKKISSAPAQAGEILDRCITELRRANHDVRSHISRLESRTVRSQTFIDAIDTVCATFTATDTLRIECRIDEDAGSHLSPAQIIEACHIAREAISNAVRHGRATQVVLHLHRDAQTLVFAVQDNGQGFDQARATHGHGLDNMQARTDALGAQLRIVSTPAQGTRVVLTFPPDQSSS